MTDGSVYKVAKFADNKLIFNETGPLFFRRGVALDIPFDCSGFRQIVKVAGTWDATINYQPKALQGVLTVKAPAVGSALPASEKNNDRRHRCLGKYCPGRHLGNVVLSY